MRKVEHFAVMRDDAGARPCFEKSDDMPGMRDIGR